jgi:hypothetical protein
MGRIYNLDRKTQGKKTTLVIWVHVVGMGTCGMCMRSCTFFGAPKDFWKKSELKNKPNIITPNTSLTGYS